MTDRRMPMLMRASLALALGLSAAAVAAQAPVKGPAGGDRSKVFIAADAPEIEGGTARISGRVNDASTRQPIADARVQISAPGRKPRAVTTNSLGQFTFTGLSAGAFLVSADRDGYMQGGSGQLRPDGTLTLVTLAAGDDRRDVSIVLWQFAAMSGRVIDSEQKALANVPVLALMRVAVGGADQLLVARTATTAADGGFEFTRLQPATYIVAALAGVPQFYASGPSAAAALPIELKSGAIRVGIDVVAGPVDVFNASGTLAGADGPAAKVRLVLTSNAPDGIRSSMTEKYATTDASGVFTFSGVPPGDYRIRAARTLMVSDPAARTSMLPTPGQVMDWAEAQVSVVDKDVTGVEMMLRAAPRVGGTVRFNGTRPTPPTADVQALQIYLEPADGLPAMVSSFGQPDATSRFMTSAVPPGRYVLRLANTRALTGWTFKSAMADGHDIADDAVALTSDLNDVVITFTDRPAQLTGSVTNPAGSPGAQAAVIVFPVDRARWSGGGLFARRRLRVRATASGNYTIIGLPAGEYFVAAVNEDEVGEWNDAATFDALSKVAKRVTIADGASASQSLVVSRLAIR